MRARWGLVLVVLCGLAAEADAKKPVVGIMDLAVDDGDFLRGTDAQVAARLTDGMRKTAEEADGPYRLSKRSHQLAPLWLLSDCRGPRTRCLAAVGKQAGIDFVIYGTVSKKANGYVVTAHLLDVQKTKIVNTVEYVIPLDDVVAAATD